ncbi:MAG: fluoride efflux transporter CrcB [Mediterranea sp.]|nr:fluoride efflux transporter CrcB [Mediterranea sp.]
MNREVFYIFIGGGVGSALRYVVQLLLHERIVPYHFPWATLAVNLVGSFLIGLFYALSERWQLSAEVRLLLTTGLCGGFTTFSTFSNDGVALLRGGFYGTFVLYVAVSIGIGLAAALAGGYAGKHF